MTKDKLLELLTEILEATPTAPPRQHGMISTGSVRRLRLSGSDLRMALALALEIVRSTPADRIYRAFQSIERRDPGPPQE